MNAWRVAAKTFLVLLPLLACGQQADNPQVTLTIGTGSVNGVYYPAGVAICRLVNRWREHHDLRCLVESSEGSISNLEKIRAAELDVGIVQSDWQYHAYFGNDRFQEAGPDSELRALFSLHSEPFTVVARADSGIKTFDDLKGKRVNIGNPGSGQRATMEVLLKMKKWSHDDFATVYELPPAQQSQAMCDNKVDAIVYTVGHPNRSVLEATIACDSMLVEVNGPEVDKLIAYHPYYSAAVIPGGLYRNTPKPVATFGVKATVVTSTRLSEDSAYQLVETVFEHFDDFRQLHPALSGLKKNAMVREGSSAPLHDGALRYFRQAGLLGIE